MAPMETHYRVVLGLAFHSERRVIGLFSQQCWRDRAALRLNLPFRSRSPGSSRRTCRSKSLPLARSRPISTVAVRAQVTGEMKAVNFQQGDDVEAGQVLFTLDHRPLEAALNQAEANLQRDNAQAANAKVIAQRMDDLVERGVGTREQRDTARTTAAALDAVVGREQRRRRKRSRATSVRHDSRAHRGAHGRPDGPCRQSRPRQRSDAACRHQSSEPDLRVVRHSGGVALRPAPLHDPARARGPCDASQRVGIRSAGPNHVRR